MPALFRTLEKIKPVYDWTYKILMFICKLLLIGDIIITAWAVAGRYIPFISDPHWSEEIVLTLMVYMAVLSATLAIRRGAHIRMTAFDSYLPKKTLLVSADILADIAVLVLGVVLVYYGVKFCNSPLSLRGKYASLPLSKFWQYLPIPVAGIGMIIFEVEQIFLHIEALYLENHKKEAA